MRMDQGIMEAKHTRKISAPARSAAILSTLFLGAVLAMPASAATLKIATVAPDGTSWMQEMRAGAEEIEHRTQGRVKMKFYTGGVMGDESTVIRKMRIGQLHGGAFTGGGLAQVYPDVRLYGLPLVFRSHDEADYIRERMDPLLLAGLEEEGYVSFGFAYGGFAKIMSDTPVTRLSDLKGRKVWVPEGDQVSYRAMEKLGLSPVTLPISDVLTGLQTGLVDIVATPALGAITFQWFTKVHYVTDVPVVYVIGTMVLSKRAFNGLSDEDQRVVREVMGEVYSSFERQNREDEAEAMDALASQGLEFVDPEEDPSVWYGAMDGLASELVEEGLFDSALHRRFRSFLDDYRASEQVADGARTEP